MATIYKISSGWRAQVRLKGMPSSTGVFPTKNEAKAWAREQEGKKLTDERDGGRPHTITTLIQTYRENVKRIGRSKDTNLRIIEYYLGNFKLSEITSKTVIEFIKRRGSERFPASRKTGRPGVAGPATLMKDVVQLNTILVHGGALLDSKDATIAAAAVQRAIKTLEHADLISESEYRTRRPTEAELIKLDEYFEARKRTLIPMMDIVLFAITTCLRQGEIVGEGGLLWEDFNEAERTLFVRGRKDPTTRKGRDMHIPLLVGPVTYRGQVIDPMQIILSQRGARLRQGRIFPYSEVAIGFNFAQAVDKCHIDNLTFHDLRHDGISRLFEFGKSIPQVAAVSGHKTWKNLSRYTHIAPATQHQTLG